MILNGKAPCAAVPPSGRDHMVRATPCMAPVPHSTSLLFYAFYAPQIRCHCMLVSLASQNTGKGVVEATYHGRWEMCVIQQNIEGPERTSSWHFQIWASDHDSAGASLGWLCQESQEPPTLEALNGTAENALTLHS